MPGEQEFDTSSGTGGSATMRVLVDTAQLVNKGISDTVNSVPVVQAQNGNWQIGAGQVGAKLGATGAIGDYIAGIWLIPTGTTLNPGAVSIRDGGGGLITLFNGGTASISNAVPWLMYLGLVSAAGAWTVNTGAGIQILALGKFT